MTEESRICRILDRSYSMIWREGRLDETLRGLDEDFEWVATDYLDGAPRRGPDSVIQFFRDWIDVWDDLHYDWEMKHQILRQRRPKGPSTFTSGWAVGGEFSSRIPATSRPSARPSWATSPG